MTVYVSDNFQRANTVSGLGVATTGQTWTVQFGAMAIQNDTAQVMGTGTGDTLYYVDSGQSDCEIQATFANFTDQAGITFRFTSGGTYWYVQFGAASGSSTYGGINPGCQLHRNNSGDSVVASNTSAIPTATSTVEVILSGTSITVNLDGTQVLQYTDTTNFNTAATKHGFWDNQHGNLGNSLPGASFSSFEVTDGSTSTPQGTIAASGPSIVTVAGETVAIGSIAVSGVSDASIQGTSVLVGSVDTQGSSDATVSGSATPQGSISADGSSQSIASGTAVVIGAVDASGTSSAIIQGVNLPIGSIDAKGASNAVANVRRLCTSCNVNLAD